MNNDFHQFSPVTDSFLYVSGIDVGSRWNDVFEICRPHVDDHILNFNDVHFLMSFLGANHKETTEKMMQSLKEFVRQVIFNNLNVNMYNLFVESI